MTGGGRLKNIPFLSIVCYRRYASGKIRPKWQMVQKRRTGRHLALKYFDDTYAPYFGSKFWPSMRIALLSQQKYGALLNNYAYSEADLLNMSGAIDIIKSTADRPREESNQQFEQGGTSQKLSDKANVEVENDQTHIGGEEMAEEDSDENEQHDEIEYSDLRAEFMPPPKHILKGPHDAVIELDDEFDYLNLPKFTMPQVEEEIEISPHLKVFAFPKGNISLFPQPKKNDVGLMGYYLLDAASLLPVLALGLNKSDIVLDMCAAPGGKSLIIAQTHAYDTLVSNEYNYMRRVRLKQMLSSYLPEQVREKVMVTNWNGTKQIEEGIFTKILVDAPCTTDRHMLFTDENNIFTIGRTEERQSLPQLQTDMLLNGLRAVRPGGAVVYSTCSLSPLQGDGVVGGALQRLQEEAPQARAHIADLAGLARCLSPLLYRLYPHVRYGQLVIPALSANFGPMYVARINRLPDNT